MDSCLKVHNRDIHIDFIKAVGIVLMVAVHGGIAAKVSNFIGLFHMAIFFMASGYLYNSNSNKDVQALRNYIIKKIRKLYLPYFLINTLFIILNNLFVMIHFLDESQYMSIGETAISILKCSLMLKGTDLGGVVVSSRNAYSFHSFLCNPIF